MNHYNFYSQYLGIDNTSEKVYISNNRDQSLNKQFIYRAIITQYKGAICASTSECIAELIRTYINQNETMEQIYTMLKNEMKDYSISYMHRMFLNENSISYMHRMFLNENNVCPLLHSADVSISFLPKYHKYVAHNGDEIIGYCKISDIYYGYGNIVVWVDEKYRSRGIASLLLRNIMDYCVRVNIVPMYLVKEENTESIGLAHKLGFETWKKEIVLCERI